jgi:cytochrome P450 PksS
MEQTMSVINAAPTAPVIELGARELRDDPYPVYARLRREAPVARANAKFLGEAWLVTRYADVTAVLKDPRFSSDVRRRGLGGEPEAPSRWMPRMATLMQDSMILMDDPDHARLRNLVHLAFTPRRVERLAVRVAEIVDELLDRAERKGRFDLIADFALPLPVTVISELMGVEGHNFQRWMAGFLEAPTAGPLKLLAGLPNGLRLMKLFERLIAQRRAEPRDDLISALVQAEQAGDRLSEDELLSMIFLLLLAGHETTVNLIGNGTEALLAWPDQYRRLHDEPALTERAVEELLRYSNPVEHGSPRFASEDVEVGGVSIARGDTVLPLLSSANRDEAVFERADALDLGRHPNRHVAFGLGIHYCVGAPLARLEGQAALGALAARFPNLRLAVPREQLRWRATVGVRGLKALPVSVR